jgi:predicted amidohydrolase YtcJ
MRISLFPLIAMAVVAVSCAGAPAVTTGEAAEASADVVFLGDYILTVDPETQGATGVAVRGDSIVAVGSREEVEGWIGETTRVVTLGSRALVPGFIDAHGHLGLVMQFIDLVNASSPPVGPMLGIDDIVTALQDRIVEREILPGEFVMGYGYDDSLLEEGRHPNRDDLDRASSEHPIALLHVSGHLVTANSAALALFGIDAETADPPGGLIRRRVGSRDPNGVLEETAAITPLRKLVVASTSPEKFATDVFKAIAYHARYGITTIQDGASSPQMVAGLRAVAAERPLPVDVAAYIQGNQMEAGSSLEAIGYRRDYENGVRVAGVKFILDGSPQGRTAWLTRPYDEGPPGMDADYVAYPTTEPEHYKTHVARLIRAGIPILAHANGDAAIDLMIEGVDLAVAATEADAELDHRSVTIHAQLAREDQLDDMKRLAIIPSFFAAHPFFWGDWHRKSFGDDRALRISPLRSASDREIPYTIHNDAPVVPADIMRLLEIAVERRTRSGFVLGADQRISVEEALHAVTLGAAYAYFEEDRKGSISVGKQADLVLLDADPRAVPSEKISDVAILETFARGQSIFSVKPTEDGAGLGGPSRE